MNGETTQFLDSPDSTDRNLVSIFLWEKLNIVKNYLVAADRTQHQFQGDLADACGAVNKMQAINECSMTKISR